MTIGEVVNIGEGGTIGGVVEHGSLEGVSNPIFDTRAGVVGC